MDRSDRYREEIDRLTAGFRSLLTGQLERELRLEERNERKDFRALSVIRIGICPGDGIGPMIMKSAVRALEYLLGDAVRSGRVSLRFINDLTLENRLKAGKALPEETLEEIKKCDVLLKGPMTTPQGADTLGSANVAIRRAMDLYANVRPITLPGTDIHWVFFRENTEGEYALGNDGVEIPGKLAMDFKVTTDAGTRRIARAACEYARSHGMKRITIVTKNNVIKKTDGWFSAICREVIAEYPELEAEDRIADIVSASILDPKLQPHFQVFLLPNLYGDILTDEAAELQGGVGTAGSMNIGDRFAMFEAIHGSAPDMIARGESDFANPVSLLRAAGLMLRHIAFTKEADQLERALAICTEEEGKYVVTGHRDGATTAEFTDYFMETLASVREGRLG